MPRALLSCLLTALLVGAGATNAQAQPAEAKAPKTVLTFYGLLKLERDPDTSDAQKLVQWQAFIKRSAEQTVYAKKALDRWKNAAKLRLVEAAREADADPKLSAPEKLAKWKDVAQLYARSKDGRQAKRRAAHWRRMETKRLVENAESVEAARRPKVERILAWSEVVVWTAKGSEARAASRRLADLQKQLFAEAQSVDRIARVDKRTKLAAWRDVLAARPTAKQRAKAQSRVAALEADLVQSEGSMRAHGSPAKGTK